MKKYIFPLLAFALLSTQSWGQTKPTEAQTELNAYMDDGLVTFKSQDGQYSFRVGGRLAVDGAYYIDDYTDRSSGADLSSARIRIFSKLGLLALAHRPCRLLARRSFCRAVFC